MNKIKKQYYDNDTDTKWFVFKSGPEAGYMELAPGVIAEYDKNSRVIGLEIQKFSRLYNFNATTEQSRENYSSLNFKSGKNISTDYKATFLSS